MLGAVVGGASLVAYLVKNPPAVQETWVRSLGWEGPLEKGKSTHSHVPAWRNSMDYIVHGITKTRARLRDFHFHTFSAEEASKLPV